MISPSLCGSMVVHCPINQRLQLGSWSVHMPSCGLHSQWAGKCRRQPVSDSPLIIDVSISSPFLYKSIKNFFLNKRTQMILVNRARNTSSQQNPLNTPPYLWWHETPLFLSGVSSLVTHKAWTPRKAFSTFRTFIGSLSCMGPQMTNPIGAVRKTISTLMTSIGFFSRVNSLVPD